MKKDLLFVLLLILFTIQLPSVAAINETQPIRPYQLSWELETSSSSIDLAPSGKFVVISTNSEIKTLDLKTGKIIQSIPSTDSQVSTNGDYIVISGTNGKIKILDTNLKEIRSYNGDTKDAETFPSKSAISLSGKNIIVTSSRFENYSPNVMILYFFENNSFVWKKEFSNVPVVQAISINRGGELIGVSYISLQKGGISKIIDKKGTILNEFEDIYNLKLSASGKYATGLKKNKAVYFNINDSSTIWEFNYNETDAATSLDQTFDSNFTVISFRNFFNILNKQGNAIQKYDTDKEVREVRISSDGKYLLVVMDNKIAMFSNDIPLLISPEADSVIEKETPIFKWDDVGALKYLIKIDNDTFEASQPEFRMYNTLSSGQHEWSITHL